jgi:replication factor C subunit 3/5
METMLNKQLIDLKTDKTVKLNININPTCGQVNFSGSNIPTVNFNKSIVNSATKNKLTLANLKSNDTLPWIEKYRPSMLNDVVSHNDIIYVLKNFVKNKQIPHLLFHGPPGTGKTSVITATARELYKENYQMMVLEINASEERGIEVVRNKITQFVATKSLLFDEKESNMFKLVILDEADAMTSDAQASLRRIIEKHTRNARFCLICNYIKNINLALQSRCVCFRFSPLKDNYIRIKMRTIIETEKIDITEPGIDTIIKRSKGDMRKILNTLQSVNMAYDVVDDISVNTCLGYPNKYDIEKIIKSLINDDFAKTFKLLQTFKEVDGYALSDIIMEIYDILIDNVVHHDNKNKIGMNLNIGNDKIMMIISLMSDIQYNLTICTNDNIQLSALIGIFKYVLNKNTKQLVKDM